MSVILSILMLIVIFRPLLAIYHWSIDSDDSDMKNQIWWEAIGDSFVVMGEAVNVNNGQPLEDSERQVVLYSTLLCCKCIIHICKKKTRQIHMSSVLSFERILDRQLRLLNRTGQVQRYQCHILLVMGLALSWNAAWSMKRQGISNPGLSNRKLLDPQGRCSLEHSVMILFSHTAKIYCRD